MALTVETGAIIADAESYVSVTDANAYHTARNNAGWTGADSLKEAALRRATSYIDWKYSRKWKGLRVAPAQPLMWPRNFVLQFEEEGFLGYANSPVYINSNVIPQCLKDAVCEAALRALTENMEDDTVTGIKSKTIGGVIETVFTGSSEDSRKSYPIVERLLSSLLKSNNNLVRG